MRISDWSSDVCSSDLQDRFDDEIGTQRNRHGRSDTGFALAGRQIHANTQIDRRQQHSVKGDKTGDAIIEPDGEIIAVERYFAGRREIAECGGTLVCAKTPWVFQDHRNAALKPAFAGVI